MRPLLIALAAFALVACSNPVNWVRPYRMEIQQGNYVTQEMVVQLKLGMTKDQVRFVLGTPLIASIFHADRWDYIFTRLKNRNSQLEERRLTVFFDKDSKLDRLDGDLVVSDGDPLPETK